MPHRESKTWIVLIVAIICVTGIICVALIVFGTPFANRLADRYFPENVQSGLVLKFDGSLDGVDNEQGYANGLSFVPGWRNQGILMDKKSTLHYLAANNISPDQGSIEFWLKPLWNGNDEQNYVFFEIGDTWYNRFRITKDGANNFRFIVWSAETEYDVACNVNSWIANEWHKVTAIWQHDHIALYLDDSLCDTETSVVMPGNLAPRLFIGSSALPDLQAQSVIDEFIIRDQP